jgi:hypothetical protein
VSPAIPSVQLRLTIEEAQIDRETARWCHKPNFIFIFQKKERRLITK